MIQLISAQTIPTYMERLAGVFQDSLLTVTYTTEASEGSIDAENYFLGPGDKIFISISGNEEVSYNLIINQEGYLYIPKVGGINLNKINLAKAKELIPQKINKLFKNVDIFIALADFRKIKVSLLGDVKKPSAYVLSGNARLIDLIVLSSGLKTTSNYRNIKIIDRFGNVNIFDLLSFLRFGDKSKNPRLCEGDIVIVDRADQTVSVNGSIKYPGIYEFKEGETVNDLIGLAGGFTSKAKTDSIEVVSFDQSGKELFSIYYSFAELIERNIKLKSQDKVLVREVPDYLIDKYVTLEGFVKYPGYYKVVEDKTTLKDVILEAGGFRENASLAEASLTRSMGTEEYDPEFERLKLIPRAELTEDEYDYFKAKSRQRKGKVVVDFVKLFMMKKESENLLLKKGDVIKVPEKKNYIALLGQVVNPGNIIFDPNLKVEDYIKLAGGFGWRAKTGDVRIIKAKTGEWIDAEDIGSLQPGDTIWVPEEVPGPKFWEVFTTSLQVLGQVASIIAAMVAVIIATR